MWRTNWRHWALATALSAVVAAAPGCGSGEGEEQEGERPDAEVLGGKADIPSWMKKQDAKDWGCARQIDGRFEGLDSAHVFTFEAKTGVEYSFAFKGNYDGSRGAAVAVYDASGKRVALARKSSRNEATATFVATTSGTFSVAAYSVSWTATGNYTLRATCELTSFNQLKVGQKSFSSYEMPPRFWRMLAGGAGLENARSDNAKSAPSGRSGEVEEGDIYKRDGNRLYYLNTYRGFMVFDVADSKAPKIVSRLPVYGYPVEMFVQNNTVYALLRDVLYLTQDKAGVMKFNRRNVSQLVSIDISTPASPKLLQAIDILGELHEGVSRKIDDTIYVVSNQSRWYSWGWQRENQGKDQAWVYSFNVQNPKSLKLVDKLQVFEGGSYSNNSATGSESRYFDKVAISATSNALMVVENWYKSGYVAGGPQGCGSSSSLQQAVVSIVDISDPSGKIKLHTKFETYGQLGDQFKQTYSYNPTTKKGTYYGIFARQEWQSQGCKGTQRIENALESWDVTNGQSPKRLAKLAFGKPNETVRGSAFDVERSVAFAITAERVDPLYAFDLSNPAKPRIASEVDGLSGDMSVFRFIAGNKFLISVGRDNSAECTGFGANQPGWQPANIAVSVIDVQDLNKIRLVQRKCVGVENASWIGSSVTWDLDQAHKMIGMHSDGLVNVVTVPVYYSKKVDQSQNGWWWYRQETAVGVMAWDLTKYDPTKSEKDQKVLENFGTVVHPEGEVKRSIVFSHKGTTVRRKMINLSNTHLSVVDMENLAKPITEAVLEVAPFYSQVFRFGNHLVEHVRAGWESSGNGASEFRVKAIGGSVDEKPALASFSVGQVEQAVKFNNALVLFRRVEQEKNGNWTSETFAVIYDLQNPLKPVLAGTVKLPMNYVPYYRFRCGTLPFWFGYNDGEAMAVTANGIVFLNNGWDAATNAYQRKLVVLSLTNLASPSVGEVALKGDADKVFYLGLVNDVASNGVYLTSKTKTGDKTVENTKLDEFKHEAQLYVHGSQLAALGKAINTPGQAMTVTVIGSDKALLSNDKTFELVKDGGLQQGTRLNLLKLSASEAELADSRKFNGQDVRDTVLDNGVLFVNAQQAYNFRGPWMGGPVLAAADASVKSAPTQRGDTLMIFELGGMKLHNAFSEEIGTENVEIMGVKDGRLFLNLSGDGILVLEVGNPSKPRGLRFVRTLGYASTIDFSGNTAFVASGYYGIYQIDMGAPLLSFN